MTKLTEIWGINSVYEQNLQEVGIASVETLLHVCAWAKQRFILAERIGIPRTAILQWVFQADLLRIDGVEPEYARLLREVGVETVADLSSRNAASLHRRIMEILAVKSTACRPPCEAEVSNWIKQAHRLPSILQY